jgi:hypothetical protein
MLIGLLMSLCPATLAQQYPRAGSTPEELQRVVKADLRRWADVIGKSRDKR